MKVKKHDGNNFYCDTCSYCRCVHCFRLAFTEDERGRKGSIDDIVQLADQLGINSFYVLMLVS
jgi:hypothetical protein